MNFFDRLARRSREAGSFLCVGLDPVFERHDVAALAAHNRHIIEATLPFAACYKPNIAFYEQWGIDGLRALEQTLRAIPDDVPVIGDMKRGDIGSTAEAYARAAFEVWDFDAVTVSPYVGKDAVEPFLAYPGRGVYVLCRTSNPGAAEFQDKTIDGRPLYETVLEHALGWGENVGLVVGATALNELRRIRELAPEASLLVPGVGAQGGRPGDVIAAAGAEPGRIVVSASRSIYYAGEGAESLSGRAAARAAQSLRDQLNEAVATIT